MKNILNEIRAHLESNAEPAYIKSGSKFFKEKVKFIGMKLPATEKYASQYFKSIKHLGKKEIFNLCDSLWQSGYMEELYIACTWSYAMRAQYAPEDFKVFEKWVSTYVSNWAACDTLCNHTVAAFLEMHPSYIESLKKWAKSQNRWMRRASAVSLIIPARNGKFLKDIFGIADILLLDQDDLVQKGYGWMLKATSEAHQAKVFDYVMKNKKIMPRTALRYAIEKMPDALRAKAMAKD